ncbi:PID-CTERM protein-sorting domain-containing protein [Mariniflexile sp. AS56]|uniref:PID-CTERM protein-sorting domain-containing protein n=1 Tax=Mariniflexile sp. AS56 TaxID=3063957 RepID=UPI0026F1AF1C|nr:hypothetical protein [Mariniflexile sp. AS56]MDO7170998.1 hypothetical protein [Mariniflexile sp. AS56]
MKTKNITFLKSINLIALTLCLVFSMNANAASLNTNLNTVATNMSSTTMKVAPAMVVLKSVTVWEWIVGLFNNKKNLGEKITPGTTAPTAPQGKPSSGGADSIPLDGGLSILLAGAAALGVKKLRDSRNKEIKIS